MSSRRRGSRWRIDGKRESAAITPHRPTLALHLPNQITDSRPMGYLTDFKLHVRKTDGSIDHLPKIDDLGGYGDWASSSLDWPQPGVAHLNEVKWYEHEDDMIALSKDHPELVWVLDGEGEDQGDVWRKFFYRGNLWTWRLPSTEPPELNPYILNDLLNGKQSD